MALPDVPGLRLVYRSLGSLAGEGTAVQIGDKVIEAEAWPEVSNPPLLRGLSWLLFRRQRYWRVTNR